jgi:hypothetical protein
MAKRKWRQWRSGVTHIFRWEDGARKLMLRHAGPLVGKTSGESVFEKGQ